MNEALSHADIVRRIKDYFNRQIAFFERVCEELADIASGSKLEQLDRVLNDDALRVRRGKELEDEFRALKKEWDNTKSIPDEDQEAVRGLAQRATELATELQSTLDTAAHHSEAQAESLSERLGDLRQGRDWLTKYRQAGPTGGGFIDHKA